MTPPARPGGHRGPRLGEGGGEATGSAGPEAGTPSRTPVASRPRVEPSVFAVSEMRGAEVGEEPLFAAQAGPELTEIPGLCLLSAGVAGVRPHARPVSWSWSLWTNPTAS